MKMTYKREGHTIEYKLQTDPAEAELWSTHRLKKKEIKIITKCDKKTAASLREEILNDIISREPNPTKKSAPKKTTRKKRQHQAG